MTPVHQRSKPLFLTKREQAALADLAPIRPTPLPIEILAAGGPRALLEWLRKGKR